MYYAKVCKAFSELSHEMKWENSQQVTLSDEQSVSQITQQEVKSTCQDILGVVIGSHNGEAAKNFGKMSIP
jgi:hypothetical protein